MPLPSSSLPKLHESLFTGPLARKHTAHLSPSPHNLLLTLACSQPELQSATTATHAQLFSLGEEGPVQISASLPLDPSVKATVTYPSPSSTSSHLELRLLSTAVKEATSLAAEVWSSGVRLARRTLAEKVGSTVLPASIFGKPRFSPSGRLVAWVAEKSDGRAKMNSYWPAPKEGKEQGKEQEQEARPFEKFEMRRNLGETVGVGGSVIVCWDWQTDSVTVVDLPPLLPEGTLGPSEAAVPSQLQFDGTDEGIIFSCHLLPSRLPGLSACLNRRCALFHYKFGSEGASSLSDGLYSAMMPRLSPDSRTLAFVCVPAPFGSHSTNVEVRTMEWPSLTTSTPPPSSAATTARVVVPKVGEVTGDGFTGFCGFHPQLDGLAWLSSTSLVFPTISRAVHALFVCEDASPSPAATPPSYPRRLHPPGWAEGSTELLACEYGTIVAQCSALNRPPQVWSCMPLSAAAAGETADVWQLVTDSADVSKLAPQASAAREGLTQLCSQLAEARVGRIQLPQAEGGAEALVVLPATTDGSPPLPWVVRPHGGPHASSVNAFSVQDAMLLASGVALVLPNYRGSLGYGDDFTHALLGHAGQMDVGDCAALVRLALHTHPSLLDPTRGGCYGGSHGGFLTAWLLGSPHKSLFRCGALWNPVVDLPAMLGATDIPEWCAAEAYAQPELKWPLSSEQLLQLRQASPISVVDQVTAPTLMVLGLGDKRVPPSQGLQYVAALSEQPHCPPVSCLEYAGEGHAIAGTEAQAHAVQSIIAWLLQQLAPAETSSATPN